MSLVAVRIKDGQALNIYVLEENGACELVSFLETVPETESARLYKYLDRMAQSGPLRNTEQSKPIAQGIFELRTWGGLRVFCFYDEGKMVLCTNGYLKKRQKLDSNAFRLALAWKQKYFAAKQSGHLELQ